MLWVTVVNKVSKSWIHIGNSIYQVDCTGPTPVLDNICYDLFPHNLRIFVTYSLEASQNVHLNKIHLSQHVNHSLFARDCKCHKKCPQICSWWVGCKSHWLCRNSTIHNHHLICRSQCMRQESPVPQPKGLPHHKNLIKVLTIHLRFLNDTRIHLPGSLHTSSSQVTSPEMQSVQSESDRLTQSRRRRQMLSSW